MPQVVTDQHIVKGQKQNGFPMRKWKISLNGVNANGEEEQLPYIEHVEYVLHHTFEQPIRKVYDYPFTLQEKGWGEFDMKIQLHFVDKATQPHVLDHDLNFQLSHYEVSHTLTFKPDLKASFLKLLKPASDYHSDSQISSNDSGAEGIAHKRRRDALAKENAKRIKEDRSSDDDTNDSSASDNEWGDKGIDVVQLAEKFQLLDTEDLLEVVKLVKANQTPDMYVKEDGEGPALKHRSSSSLPRSAAARVEIAEVLRSYQASIGEIFCDLRTSMETINSTTASAATTFHDVAKETGKTLQSFNQTTALSLEAVGKLAREHWDAEVPAAERRAQGRGQSHHQPSSPSATQGHLKFSAPSPSSSELQPNMKRRRVQFEDLDYCTRDTPVTSSMDEPPRPQKKRRSIRSSFSFPADTSRNSIQTTLAAVTSESRGKIEQEEAIFEAHDELDRPMSGEAIHEELDRHMVDNEMQDVDMSSHGTQEIQESGIDEMDHTLHQLSLQRSHQQITDGFRMARLTIAQERPRVRDLVRSR
ncbi:hypothetical protein DFQ26_006723 [Actinomortierella ambigua]|nr:hypothetical protein DFQ26_006723 [Actinomortierella ambigua]